MVTARDVTGAPLRHVSVRAGSAEGRTDEDGVARLDGDAPTAVDRLTLAIGDASVAVAGPWVIPAGVPATIDVTVPRDTGAAVRVVRSEDRRPIGGVAVRLETCDGGDACTKTSRTSEDGIARFDGVRLGWYRIGVSSPDIEDRVIHWVALPTADAADVAVAAYRVRSARGRVVDPHGVPIAGVRFATPSATAMDAARATTDGDGRFVLQLGADSLLSASGAWSPLAESCEWAWDGSAPRVLRLDGPVDGARSPAGSLEPVSVDVLRLPEDEGDIVLDTSRTWRCRVENATGRALRLGGASISSATGMHRYDARWIRVEAGATREFAFRGAPESPGSLQLSFEGSRPKVWLLGESSPSATPIVRVRDPGVLAIVGVNGRALPDAVGVFTAPDRAASAGRDAIEAGMAWACGDAGPWRAFFPPGVHRVRLAAAGYCDADVPACEIRPGEVTRAPVEFVRPGALHVLALRADAPVGRTRIRLRCADAPESPRAYPVRRDHQATALSIRQLVGTDRPNPLECATDARGRVTIGGLVPGEYVVEGDGLVTSRVVVGAGDCTEVRLQSR